jgi:hypothetical protein
MQFGGIFAVATCTKKNHAAWARQLHNRHLHLDSSLRQQLGRAAP